MADQGNDNHPTIRSSAAEYLTYIAATGDNPQSIEMRYEDENIWLTQKMMAVLYDVEIPTINVHIKKVFADKELPEASTIRKFLIVQKEGTRQVEREVIHGHTAAELIYIRADAEKQNMGLQTWEAAPSGKICKSDTFVAKNYLDKEEMQALELIVSGYLDFAESQAKRNIPMTMQDWARHLDRILMATEHELLTNAGTISMEVARQHAETEFEKFRIVQDRLFESDFDRFLALEESRKQIDLPIE